MPDNIIRTDSSTIILNGGNPLFGCPKDYNDADQWAEEANKDKDGFEEPTWSFDCGFKLDFDGPILSVESRFYPPKTHYGPKWDGEVRIRLFSKKIIDKRFECDTIDQLRDEVEGFLKEYVGDLERRII